MRWNKMSYRAIEEVLEHILPIGKDVIYALVQETIQATESPEVKKKSTKSLGMMNNLFTLEEFENTDY